MNPLVKVTYKKEEIQQKKVEPDDEKSEEQSLQLQEEEQQQDQNSIEQTEITTIAINEKQIIEWKNIKNDLKTKTIFDHNKIIDTIYDIRQEYNEFISLDIQMETAEQFAEMEASLQYMTTLKYLSGQFKNNWFEDIQGYQGINNNQFDCFFVLQNITAVNITFEKCIYQKILGDFCICLKSMPLLENLQLIIPGLCNNIDQVNCDKITSSINTLEHLQYYSLEITQLNSIQDYNLVQAFIDTIHTHNKLKTFKFIINASIYEDILQSLIYNITQANSLDNLDINIQKIISRKSIDSYFKPLLSLTNLKSFAVNIYNKSCHFVEKITNLSNLQFLKLQFNQNVEMNLQEMMESLQFLQCLEEINFIFDENNKYNQEQKWFDQLCHGLKELQQINSLQITFKDSKKNGINYLQSKNFMQSLKMLNQLEKIKLSFGKNHLIGKENVLIFSECLKQMNNLNSLELKIADKNSMNKQCIQQIYDSIINHKKINYLNFDLYNSNALLFVNLINHLPLLCNNNFIIKNLNIDFNRYNNNLNQDITQLQINLSSTFSQNHYDDYNVSFLNSFTSLKYLSLNLHTHNNITNDMTQSLQNLNQLNELNIIISQRISNEEIIKLGQSFEGLINLNKLKLHILKGEFDEQSYKSLSESLSKLTSLEKFKFFVQSNQFNKKGEIQFYQCLKNMVKLRNLTVQLGSFDILQEDQTFYLNKAIEETKNIQNVLIKNKLTLNEKRAFSACENLKHLKSITLMKLMVNFNSCYELKLLLEKGIQYLSNLRYLSITHNLEVEQKRIITQRSNIIRNIKRLVVLSV